MMKYKKVVTMVNTSNESIQILIKCTIHNIYLPLNVHCALSLMTVKLKGVDLTRMCVVQSDLNSPVKTKPARKRYGYNGTVTCMCSYLRQYFQIHLSTISEYDKSYYIL